MRYETVLIDFDGTMINTKVGIINSWKYAFKKIRGIDVCEETLKDTMGEPIKYSLQKFFPEYPVEESLRIYREYALNGGAKPNHSYEGVVETVRKLKARGHKVGLVTSRTEKSALEGLKKEGILDCFDTFVTADSPIPLKPNPDPIELAIANLGSDKARSIMVGDTVFDMKAAKSACVDAVLVGWSEERDWLERDERYRAKYIIEKFSDLLDLV